MANEDLVNYITKEKTKGTSKEAMRSGLIGIGWQEKDIDDAMTAVFGVQAPLPPDEQAKEKPGKEAPGKKKVSFTSIVVSVLLVFLAAGGTLAYFFLIYTPCPAFIPPGEMIGNAVMGHSSENPKNLPDIIDLNMNLEDGTLTQADKWKTYVEDYDFRDYDVIKRQPEDYRCFKGDASMKQDTGKYYCSILLKNKKREEERALWLSFDMTDKRASDISFASYPGFNPVSWAIATLSLSKSYCGKASMSSAQTAQIKPGFELFNPGTIKEEYALYSNRTYINVTNGAGIDIMLKNIKAGTCENDLADALVKDKTKAQFQIDCGNGEPGVKFSGFLKIRYSEGDSAEEKEYNADIDATIVEEAGNEAVAAEEEIPLLNPCSGISTCTGVVYNHGGPVSLAPNGNGYGVIWANEKDGESNLYFMPLSSEGNKTGPERNIMDAGAGAKRPSAAWTGSGYNIAWAVGSSVYFIRTDAEGRKISNIKFKETAGPVDTASIAWAGNESGIAWSESDGKSYFARFDADGSKIGSDIEIGLGSSSAAAAVWIGFEYGVGWIETTSADKRQYLVRIENGEKISTVKLLGDPISCQYLALSWADSRYGLASSCSLKDYDELHFTRIHSTGGNVEMIELDQAKAMVSNSKGVSGHYAEDPSLFMTSDTYGAAWRDNRDGNDEIYFALIDSYSGSIIDKEMRVTDSIWESGYPSIVKTGSNITSEYAIAWVEKDGDKEHVYFARVS